MNIHDLIARRMAEFDRLYALPRNSSDEHMRELLIELGQKQEPGTVLPVDVASGDDEEIDAIMRGKEIEGC